MTDEQWAVVEPLFPVPGKGRSLDDQRVINGVMFQARTGISWRGLSKRYGLWKTVHDRLWRWPREGTLAMLVAWARVLAEAVDGLDREVAVDSSAS